MDAANDSGALLQRESDREVVQEEKIGQYQVQLLEGPTDNPYRVLVGQESYTFYIEGMAWNIMCLIMRSGTKEQKESFIGALLHLIESSPEAFGAEVSMNINSSRD